MRGIEHTGFIVNDLEKSINFYRKLGFNLLRKTSMPHAMMYLGETIIELSPGLNIQPHGFHLALYTDNIEEDVAKLTEQGIESTPIETAQGPLISRIKVGIVEYADPHPVDSKLVDCMMPNMNWKRTTFKDPDGINIELWQRN